MAIQKSSLVTAPSGVKMKQYILNGVYGKVNEEEIVVDKKAHELYENIYDTYTQLNKYFQEIGEEYRRCASQSVKGDGLETALKKLAKNCENQGQYCLDRQERLAKDFKMAVTESSVGDLEVAAGGQYTATATTATAAVAGTAGASYAASSATATTNTISNKDVSSANTIRQEQLAQKKAQSTTTTNTISNKDVSSADVIRQEQLAQKKAQSTTTPKVAANYTPETKEFKQKQKEGNAIRQAEFKAEVEANAKKNQQIQKQNQGNAIREAEFKADTKKYQEIQARNKAKTSPTTITGAAKSVVAKPSSTTSKTIKTTSAAKTGAVKGVNTTAASKVSTHVSYSQSKVQNAAKSVVIKPKATLSNGKSIKL